MAVLVSSLVGCSGSGGDSGDVDLSDENAKRSYALGMDMGSYLVEMDVDLDLGAFTKAIQDQIDGNEPRIEAAEAEMIRQDMMRQAREKRMQEMQDMAQTNIDEGANFMAENKNNPDVVTTASGLQFTVLEDADGPKPGATDRVTVHYRGTLIDGTRRACHLCAQWCDPGLDRGCTAHERGKQVPLLCSARSGVR